MSLWQSTLYTDLYGTNARLDTFGINTDITPTETVADAFLSWVRDAFGDAADESQASGWISFFASNIGKFLRNAVIYNYPGGMIQYYLSMGKIYTPSTTRTINTNLTSPVQIRLAPIVDATTNLGAAFDPNNPNTDNDLQSTRLYGWAQNNGNDWFLIEDNHNRLVWIADFGINPEPGIIDKATDREILDPLSLSPGQPYQNGEVDIVIGDGE